MAIEGSICIKSKICFFSEAASFLLLIKTAENDVSVDARKLTIVPFRVVIAKFL